MLAIFGEVPTIDGKARDISRLIVAQAKINMLNTGMQWIVGWATSVTSRHKVDFIPMLSQPISFHRRDSLNATRRVRTEETIDNLHIGEETIRED